MDKGNDDTRARITNGMTQCDSATVDVNLGSRDIKNLLGDVNDDGKGLIDLKQGDFVNG